MYVKFSFMIAETFQGLSLKSLHDHGL